MCIIFSVKIIIFTFIFVILFRLSLCFLPALSIMKGIGKGRYLTMSEVLDFAKKVPITVGLVILNIVTFLVLEIMGDTTNGQFMLAHGALNPEMVLYGRQWYRLMSSMFLHFGGIHLANNMFLLLVLGQLLERAVGPVKYFAIYFGSGLIGAFVSLVHMLLVGANDISAGASGAIFGIIGGLVVVVLVHKGKYQEYTTKKMLLMVALALYAGFSTSGVDNFNHIGGVIGGVVLTFFIYGIPYLVRSHKGLTLGKKN